MFQALEMDEMAMRPSVPSLALHTSMCTCVDYKEAVGIDLAQSVARLVQRREVQLDGIEIFRLEGFWIHVLSLKRVTAFNTVAKGF